MSVGLTKTNIFHQNLIDMERLKNVSIPVTMILQITTQMVVDCTWENNWQIIFTKCLDITVSSIFFYLTSIQKIKSRRSERKKGKEEEKNTSKHKCIYRIEFIFFLNAILTYFKEKRLFTEKLWKERILFTFCNEINKLYY